MNILDIVNMQSINLQEPVGTYSKLNPKDTYEDLDLLEEKDLLNFSRQIAAGMVSSILIQTIVIMTASIALCHTL